MLWGIHYTIEYVNYKKKYYKMQPSIRELYYTVSHVKPYVTVYILIVWCNLSIKIVQIIL